MVYYNGSGASHVVRVSIVPLLPRCAPCHKAECTSYCGSSSGLWSSAWNLPVVFLMAHETGLFLPSAIAEPRLPNLISLWFLHQKPRPFSSRRRYRFKRQISCKRETSDLQSLRGLNGRLPMFLKASFMRCTKTITLLNGEERNEDAPPSNSAQLCHTSSLTPILRPPNTKPIILWSCLWCSGARKIETSDQ